MGTECIIVGKMLTNNSRSRNIELPKDTSFKPSKASPLITIQGESKIAFAQLDRSKLIHAISHIDILLLAYELIKSKPGNMTQGVHKETLDGININWFQNTSKQLLAGQYKFNEARQVLIHRKGKSKERPITIASPREKIVQKAITIVLTEVFEPIFSDHSHGYRPDKGCHSALEMIDRTFRGSKWIIEADLSKCFESIPHNKVIRILERNITCKKTLALISSGLKAGYVFLGKKIANDIIGIPQGSVLSPLICNIYLHELDIFMEQLIIKNTLGKARRKNPAYRRLQYLIEKAKDQPDIQKALRRKLWLIPSKDPLDPNFRRLAYVRYSDDFVISITGPCKLANDIRVQVDQFLKEQLNLELNQEKTLITKASEGFNFLGARITNRKITEKPIKLMKAGPTKGHLSRISPRLSFHAPIRKLIDRLVIRGYFTWSKTLGRARPTAMRSIVNLDHSTILQIYNYVIQGLLNYYKFADNRKSMGCIIHGLKGSCALTLALKYKQRTASKIYKAYGSKLTCPETNRELYIPKSFSRFEHTIKFSSINVNKSPEEIIKRAYTNRLTKSSFGKRCIICGDHNNIQMHHLKRIRELRKRAHKNWFIMQMAAINRKQVPLCANHHHRLHNNSLSDFERKRFSIGCKELLQASKSSKGHVST